jgi:hypothetical protein
MTSNTSVLQQYEAPLQYLPSQTEPTRSLNPSNHCDPNEGLIIIFPSLNEHPAFSHASHLYSL